MLSTFFGDISGRRRRRRERAQAGEWLLAHLDRNGQADVDALLAETLGVGLAALRHAVYGLAIAESLHLVGNKDGRIRAMTNQEFARRMTARAETETPTTETDELTATPADYGWFALDIAPEEPDPEKDAGPALPTDGQILPERAREAWDKERIVELDAGF